jgi:signal transduction histidine kinase
MCHEFNNPLAAIRLSTYTLGRQMQDDDGKALLHKLNEDITKLERQIVKLRDLGAATSADGS